jgi:ABC-type multidrug transport system fused ATPase/permease subunit
MTKWSRVRRRKERREAEAEERRKAEELQSTEPQIEDLNTQQEKSSENIQQTRENVEQENTQTFKQKPILSQIPRYVYLVAFFALLSGVFYPLITPYPAEQNLDNVLKGTAILFLGLTGTILVYKGTTLDKNRAAVVSLGLVLIAVSLALIFTIAGVPV